MVGIPNALWFLGVKCPEPFVPSSSNISATIADIDGCHGLPLPIGLSLCRRLPEFDLFLREVMLAAGVLIHPPVRLHVQHLEVSAAIG